MDEGSIEVLLVEDNPGDARLIQEILAEVRGTPFDLEHVDRLSAGLERLSSRGIDVVLLDLSLPDSRGLDTFVTMHAQASQVPIIVLTGLDDEELAVTAVREGAQDYLVKGQVDSNLLVRAIRYAIERKRGEERLRKAHDELESRVRERTAELQESHEKLEARVLERTAELAKVNEELHEEIVERKRVEEEKEKMQIQLRQAQKMEAIGTLSGGIAHDFNNILTAILGYTEIVLDDIPEGTETRQRLGQVLKASHRARDLVRQILAFSRQSEQELQPVRISHILKEALKLLRASLPSTIEIQQYIETETGTGTILADPTQIHQVLMNLCANAAHAMRETGGVLKVTLGDVELDAEETAHHPIDPGSYQRLTVGDTGHGMDPATIERIFDPYFTTKTPGEGTGLGLAVVHGIVRSHGGAITVHSKLGKGSTFQVLLPRIKSESVTQAERSVRLPGGKERILLVDDEDLLVTVVREMLTRLGYDVVGRTSSVEALELFRRQPDGFDLVITDQTMPHMTGADFAEALLRIRPDLPIILCTGFSEVITEEEAKAIGIREFVMKPMAAGEIAQIIRRVLDA